MYCVILVTSINHRHILNSLDGIAQGIKTITLKKLEKAKVLIRRGLHEWGQ